MNEYIGPDVSQLKQSPIVTKSSGYIPPSVDNHNEIKYYGFQRVVVRKPS